METTFLHQNRIDCFARVLASIIHIIFPALIVLETPLLLLAWILSLKLSE
jgi:hypothetical protein